jgi:DNA invertase Pin-like site-specific DNA recombinase
MKLDKRFVDKASGKDLHRPELEQLSGYVREGDTVICHSMDRLARNLARAFTFASKKRTSSTFSIPAHPPQALPVLLSVK